MPVQPDPAVRGEVVLLLGPDFSRLATPAEIAAARTARADAAAVAPGCPAGTVVPAS